MAQKTDVVIYIDRASMQHNALVVGVNNLNPDVLDVTYFDLKSDALKTEFGVPHMSDESKKETNPALPQYSLNCWKNYGEEHLALPVDHPANDHPFELKKQDDSGRIVAKARPEFEKHLAEVHAGLTEQFATSVEAAADPSLSAEGRAIAEQTGETPVENVAKPLPPVEVASDMPITAAAIEIQLAASAELDVIAQLDAAGPAPVVEEKKPDDAA